MMEQCIEKRSLVCKRHFLYADEFGIMHADEKIVNVGVVGDHLIYFVYGRERKWHKQEMKHVARKMRTRFSGKTEIAYLQEVSHRVSGVEVRSAE